MARRTFALLLSALTALASLSHSKPVHNHHALHLARAPRHGHTSLGRRDVVVLEEEEDKLAKRSDNESSPDTQNGAWLDDSEARSTSEQTDLDQLIDDLGLSYSDVRELVQKYADDGWPPACTSTGIASTSLPTVTASQTSSPPTASSTNTSPRPVNNGARNMNVVYYAQTPATQQVPLTTICQDGSIDIVVLAFVTDFFSAGGYPTLNLASKCWAASQAQTSLGAIGLIDCVSDGFAAQVAQCQSAGKKVMLSLGGYISNMDIPSAAAASTAAQNLWDLFLGGGQSNAAITAARPFGSLVLDGIDFDNENPNFDTYIPDLARALRTLMDSDPSGKEYLLSAAPQCPRPDASIPIAQMLDVLDYVWVQFYNNPSCNVGAGQAFLDSVLAWSGDLAATPVSSTPEQGAGSGNFEIGPPSSLQPARKRKRDGSSGPQLLIGVLATQQGTGYVDPTTLGGILHQVKALNVENLAGVMYWDGSYVELSGLGDGSKSYSQVVREVLA